MMKVAIHSLAAAAVLISLPASAQESGDNGVSDTATRNPFWQAAFGSGGHYMVRLDRIASISRHRYILDGGILVDEVTVDTSGQALARFYHLEPATAGIDNDSVRRIADRAGEIVNQAASRSGSGLHNMVAKTYPGTTHAKSIEYRLASKAEVDALYASLRRAWESGEGRSLKVAPSP